MLSGLEESLEREIAERRDSFDRRLAPGVSASYALKRSSPAWQAAYRLSRGGTAFNGWRRQRPKQRDYIRLGRIAMTGLDLSGADLSKYQFPQCFFEDVDFRSASLAGCNLNRTFFINCRLEGANLRGARLADSTFVEIDFSDVDLFQSVRDGWRLRDIECRQCWITKSRESNPNSPEEFEPTEFAICFGAERFRIRFPGGFEAVDLIALPFYLAKIADEFPNRDLVFAGLNTIGEAVLEFATLDRDEGLESAIQATLNEISASIRDTVQPLAKALERTVEMTVLPPTQSSLPQGNQEIYILKDLSNLSELRIGGDSFTNYGSVSGFLGSLGGRATVEQSAQLGPELLQLRQQLEEVQEALSASQENSPEAVVVAEALVALDQGDEEGFWRGLRRAGREALRAARDIGVEVAGAAISHAMGLR